MVTGANATGTATAYRDNTLIDEYFFDVDVTATVNARATGRRATANAVAKDPFGVEWGGASVLPTYVELQFDLEDADIFETSDDPEFDGDVTTNKSLNWNSMLDFHSNGSDDQLFWDVAISDGIVDLEVGSNVSIIDLSTQLPLSVASVESTLNSYWSGGDYSLGSPLWIGFRFAVDTNSYSSISMSFDSSGLAEASVPEPSTYAMAAFGLVGLALYGWRRKRA